MVATLTTRAKGAPREATRVGMATEVTRAGSTVATMVVVVAAKAAARRTAAEAVGVNTVSM